MPPSISERAAALVSTLDLLQSLFPLPGELEPCSDTLSSLPLLQSLVDTPNTSTAASLPEELRLLLSLALDPSSQAQPAISLQVAIALPVSWSSAAPTPKLSVQQPSWLSRSEHLALLDDFQAFLCIQEARYEESEGGAQFVLEGIEWLRDTARGLYDGAVERSNVEEERKLAASKEGKNTGPLVRAWMWFPSLSTREKRDDIVNWAPQFHLTGFVLAGKPALLCLEGTAQDIASYMSDIKSISWGDIPSFQKKVSERDRENITTRAFSGMQEITSLIDKNGQRGNRGDMGQVKDWLTAKGLGDAFGKVVGGGSFLS